MIKKIIIFIIFIIFLFKCFWRFVSQDRLRNKLSLCCLPGQSVAIHLHDLVDFKFDKIYYFNRVYSIDIDRTLGCDFSGKCDRMDLERCYVTVFKYKKEVSYYEIYDYDFEDEKISKGQIFFWKTKLATDTSTFSRIELFNSDFFQLDRQEDSYDLFEILDTTDKNNK